jgi:electron transport complex protein RnfE
MNEARVGGDRLPWTVAALVPSLAATTLEAALWLSAAVLVSAIATTALAALLARRVPAAAGSLAVLVLLAALTGAADRAAAAWLPALHAGLGIALPVTVVLLPGALAASPLRAGRADRPPRGARGRAAAGVLAFLAGACLVALAREALGAGTITIPGFPDGRALALAGIAEAPARGLLLPLGGLIAAGYLAGLAGLVTRVVKRRADSRAGRPSTGVTP